MNSTLHSRIDRHGHTQPWYTVLLLLAGTLLALSAYGQDATITVSGKVTADDTQEGIPGVNIVVKGTNAGAITDAAGTYTITAPAAGTLVFSSIGFASAEVAVNNHTALNVGLKTDINELQEIVIVGYDTRERKDLVGSIAKVDPAATKAIPAGSFDAQLQGKIAGVQIASNTGVPGEAVNVRIRGVTSINADVDPLYIVDGVFVNSNSLQKINTGGKATSPIADINPADIESVEVLKDASATALYGSRAANGVIVITTRRGNYEQKPTISFNASHGWAKAAKLWHLTTGPEHAQLVNEFYSNAYKDAETAGNTADMAKYKTVPFRAHDDRPNETPAPRGLPEDQQTYDRLGELFRTAHLQNYDLSLAGGTKTTRYYIGAGYNTQEAIIRPITFERASFKVNLDQRINDKVLVGVSNTFTRTYRNQARAGDGPQGGLLQSALHTPTYISPYDANGVLVAGGNFDNLTLLLDNYDVNSRSLRYVGNLFLEADLLPELKFRTSVGADYNNYEESEYWNTFTTVGGKTGLATSGISQNATLLNEQVLTYRHTFGSAHTVGILVGNTLQSDATTRTYAEGSGFANNSVKLISQAATVKGSQTWTRSTLVSFFSRLDYNYADKYLLDVSFRADGSSRFGANNRWGYFPSVGVAWRIKEEGFLQDVETISDLKLRASFGISGNQNIGDFAWQGQWGAGASYNGNPGIAPSQLANPDLKWEETRQWNLGLDVTLLDRRLTFEVNAYDKYTHDGLLKRNIPSKTGFTSIWDNAIEVSNRGFELGITTVNLRKTDLTWTTSLNVSRNVNKIEKLETPLRFGSRDLILQREGSPLYSFWVYKQLYVDPQTGDAVYEDVDGVPGITVNDRQLIGSIWPKYFGGITNEVTYKGFDLNVFFAFSYGNKVYNHNKFFGEGGGARDASRVIFASNLARWQKPGDITDVPRPQVTNVNNYRDGGSRWLEDGSYLRLRSLTLGYTLPSSVTERLKLEKLRIYAVGTNLWLLTDYTGLDPESSSSSSQNEPGIDLGTPPQPRGLQIGIDLRL
ncbi:SusC/RagA family TonB-linked outer membrane protein [Dawidia soli]|uniref:TonB-dependent receptor n=1 Tax=Dawidia soli TaxID=2782352 RepID=A0AAP2D4I1_9BACT|nr:TonB-dependent receptor [Dawidia soli]MBT1685007.1 TonB-dependent receptor [Dawidia soli]